jgi:hypothetical protein
MENTLGLLPKTVKTEKRGRRSNAEIEAEKQQQVSENESRKSQLLNPELNAEQKKEIQQLIDDFESGKQKTTYKKKKETRQINDEEIKTFTQAYQPSIEWFLDFMAKRMPNPIPVSTFEREHFTAVVIPCAMKWMNTDFKYKEEVNALFGVGMFVLPRLSKSMGETNAV